MADGEHVVVLVGPPLPGLLMQAAGTWGALVAGGLLIAGAVGGGGLLSARRPSRGLRLRRRHG